MGVWCVADGLGGRSADQRTGIRTTLLIRVILKEVGLVGHREERDRDNTYSSTKLFQEIVRYYVQYMYVPLFYINGMVIVTAL